MQLGGAMIGLAGLPERTAGHQTPVSVQETDGEIHLSNDQVTIRFDAQTGGIVQIANANGLGLREPRGEGPDAVWGLQFYSDQYDNVLATSWEAPDPAITTTDDAEEASITMEFDGVPMKAPGNPEFDSWFDGIVTVTATVQAGSPLVFWDCSVNNQSERAIRAVRCPYITNIGPLANASSDRLIVPQRSGRKITNPIPLSSGKDIRYPSGFGTMQFSAYLGETGGFYLDARDTEGYTKRITWDNQWTESDHLYTRYEHNVPQESGADVTVPYQVTVGPVGSRWYDAADRYRRWLDSTDIVPESTKEWPDWYLNLGATFHATSYIRPGHDQDDDNTDFETTADRTISIQESLDFPIQLSWWGYQTHGNFGAGDWFPPKEGWEQFDSVVDRVADNDVSLLGYALTNMLLEESDLYQTDPTAKDWLVRGKDGSPRTGSLHGMVRFKPELAQTGWQSELFDVFESFVFHGAKQVQLDGFPWTGTPECYSDAHSHPEGLGGNWYAQASQQFLSELEDRLTTIDETTLISGEGFADFYLPELDIAMSRDVRVEAEDPMVHSERASVIPLIQYAFGDHVAFRGSNHFPLVDTDWTEAATYLRLITGRSLEWGMLPLFRVAIEVPKHEQSESLLTYLQRVGEMFHRHGTRFLIQGQMRPKPSITVPQVETTTQGPTGDQVTVTADTVLHSVWETTQLGKAEQAAIFTNISKTTQSVTVGQTHLGGTDGLIYSVTNGRYERQSLTGGELAIDIPSRSVVIVVRTPASDTKEAALDQIASAQGADIGSIEPAINAFVSGEYANAIDIVTKLRTESATETATETEPATAESTLTSTQPISSDSTAQTATESPGFQLLATIGAIATTVAGLGWWRTADEETQTEEDQSA